MATVSSAEQCQVSGRGLSIATVRQLTTFTVTAQDSDGQPQTEGGDTFFVAIRGASRVRAKVTDNADGTYSVAYRPSVSGTCAPLKSHLLEPGKGWLKATTSQDTTRHTTLLSD